MGRFAWSAEWLWAARGKGAPDEATVARFKAALSEAAQYRDSRAREAAEAWFRGAGIPVPEPDLEGKEGGG